MRFRSKIDQQKRKFMDLECRVNNILTRNKDSRTAQMSENDDIDSIINLDQPKITQFKITAKTKN